jgi:hypothetical protein
MTNNTTSFCRVCLAPTNVSPCDAARPYICPGCRALEAAMLPADVEAINSMHYEEMLRLHRHTPAAEGYFAHRETGEYFAKVMNRKRAEAGHAAHVAASKAIGWQGGDR